MNRDTSTRRNFLQLGAATALGLMIPGVAKAANVRDLSGTVFINRRRATLDSLIRAGDLVTTSANGRISFVVNNDAFMLKEHTSLRIGAERSNLIDTLRLLTGKLLSVFETGRERRIITANATIGVRGTACFLNARPASLYYCNCYGETQLRMKDSSMDFKADHHSAHEIKFDDGHYMGMAASSVLDHDDEELRFLESLVGRIPDFDRS